MVYIRSPRRSVPSDEDAVLSPPRNDGANVLATANRYDDAVSATLSLAQKEPWVAGDAPCLGRYPDDHHTQRGPPRTADGRVRWNSNLQWSQAAYLLLVEHRVRGEPFGLAPNPGAERPALPVRSERVERGRPPPVDGACDGLF
jgi:hypothetical protein